MTRWARLAYRRVLRVSGRHWAEGDTQATWGGLPLSVPLWDPLPQELFLCQPLLGTMRVTPRPPSESASSLVSLLSRKGMWLCFLCGSSNREMQ